MKDNEPYGYGVSIDSKGKEFSGYYNGFGAPASQPYDAIPAELQKGFNLADFRIEEFPK